MKEKEGTIMDAMVRAKEILLMALRNLSRQKKRTILLAGAIGFSIMVVMLINGIANSFLYNLTENVSNLAAGHVFVTGEEQTVAGNNVNIIREAQAVDEAVEASGFRFRYVTKRSELSGLLVYEGKTMMQAISGIDIANERFLPERVSLVEGSFADMSARNAIVIAKPVADKLGVKLGYFVQAKLETATGQQTVGKFKVVAIMIDTGIFSSIYAYANISYVNELLGIAPDSYQALGYFLESLDDMDAAGLAIHGELSKKAQVFERASAGSGTNQLLSMMNRQKRETWQGVKYRITTLNDELASAKQMVDYLNVATLFVLVILFVIIMVGISNTFRIIMFERIREIGTMRAVGMQRRQVRALFLSEALLLSLVGITVGLALSWIAMTIISSFGFSLDNPLSLFMMDGHITFSTQLGYAVMYSAIVALLTLVAAISPARKAAMLSPAVALGTFK